MAMARIAVGGKPRVITRVAKAMLLKGQNYFWNGKSYYITAKSVGAGVYELTGEVK